LLKSFLVRLWFISVFIVVMGGALWVKRSVNASEPGKDYWFIETFALGDVKLPAGVIIQSSDPAASPRGYLDLENQTAAVLYVLSLNYKDVVVMKTPDPNYKNRLNAAHEVASYLVAPDRPARLGMEALTDLDRILVDKNVLSSDPPPENTPIPKAQNSELLLVYNEQVLVVPFTVTYALNAHFAIGSTAIQTRNPTQASPIATAIQAAGTSGLTGMKNCVIAIGFAGVTILTIAGWLAWRKLSPHR
jgi:hypothetical protein